MMAALTAANANQRVLLLEKMDQPGRKLRITGKGRCNLTNTASLKDFLGHVGSDSRFMRNTFSRFFNQELMDFFEKHGVPLTIERGSRVFPTSGKSLDIFLALINPIEHHKNITILKNQSVDSLLISSETHAIVGVRMKNGECHSAKKVILATGGQSYPSTGSTGDGYILAQQAGHSIVPCVPSLVPLICDDPIPHEMIGFVLKNVTLSIERPDGKKLFEMQGEMTFTEDGLTGPLVLSASRIASRPLHEGQPLVAKIDLKPALSNDTLDKRLISDLDSNGSRILNDAMRMWLPAELIPFAFKRLKIEQFKRLNQVNGNERKKILQFLKGTTFTLKGTRDYPEAIVTQGGVSLKEVNPKTLESKLVKGLFFAGEILDLDADTGGYNLQIAFSTGFVAGSIIE